MEPTPSAPPPAANTGARVLLGVFILGQLFFLVSVNFLELFREARTQVRDRAEYQDVATAVEPVGPGWVKEKGQFHDLCGVLEPLSRRYGQVTGQSQSWALFAEFDRQCVFPAVELRWDDDPQASPALAVLAAQNPFQAAAFAAAAARQKPGPTPRKAQELRSDNEPADPEQFFRAGNFRLRRYEGHLTLALVRHADTNEAETRQEWNRRTEKHLRNNGDAILAYLRWRLAAYQSLYPGLPPPRQVILKMRRYRIAEPDQAPPYLRGPFVVPVARWQPHAVWQAGYGPLEKYNHVTQRFEGFRK
jgi:hypothetical protein